MRRVVEICAAVACFVALSACTDKQSYIARGNKLFEAGKYADASINYRKAIQKDSRFGEAYYRLGLTAIKQGDANQAYAALMQAVELLPDNEDAKGKLGDLCLNSYLRDPHHPQQLYDQITRLADRLLAKNPDSFDGLRFKALLARTDRKPEEAIASFRKALQVKPADPALTTALADTLYQNGQSQEAEAVALDLIARNKTYGPVYDQLYGWYFKANRIADAENILKTKVKNNPKQADYILQLGLHYNRLHKSAEMSATLGRLLDNRKDFPNAPFQVGDFYMNIRNFAEAIRYYQEAARANPQDNIACQKRITDALLAQGKKTEASSSVEQILKEQPKDESALRVRASLWLDSRQPGNVDKALREFTALSALHPEDPLLWFQMGRASRLKGDQETARKQFQEAVARRKDFVEARFQLAAINLSQHRNSEAMQQASEILSLRPNDPRARMLHAVALFSSGNKASARTELTQLSRDFPQYAEPRLELGLVALSEKKYQEAKEIFGKLGGNDPRAVSGLAAASSSERQFAKAIELLNGALQKSPDSLMLREQLANTAVAAGQYDLAIAEFKKLLASESQSVPLRVRLGEVYELKGDNSSAIALYREAQALSPQDPVSGFLLAVALDRTGQRDEAQTQYRNLLKLHPDSWATMNNLAFLLAETGGDLDEALSLAQRAAQKFPSQSSFSDTIGYVYLKKGMRDSAVRTFSGLVQKYPNNPTFHYHLGMALLETGDKAAARTELGAALANHPSANEAAKIRELASKIG
ncbi:MAG: tetratricopeptide repeat protein [Acidobacteriia bacterium]|nr:tetratricopeptide repeat protein [Terriglobia bacterium]